MGETPKKIRTGSLEMIKVILTKVAQSKLPQPKIFAEWIYPAFRDKWSEKFFVTVLQYVELNYPDYYKYLIVPSEWNGGSLKKFPDIQENDGSSEPPAGDRFYIKPQQSPTIHSTTIPKVGTPHPSPLSTPIPTPVAPASTPVTGIPVRFKKDLIDIKTNSENPDSIVVCPRCKTHIPHVPLTQKERFECNCGYTIIALNIFMKDEKNKQSSIQKGTQQQKTLLDTYLRYNTGLIARDRPTRDSIDYTILRNGKLDHYLEIKERTNTLNAFQTTRITLHKMEVAKRLFTKTGKDTLVLIKFIDCWALYKVDPTKNYKDTAIEWGRNDRPYERMMYADILITELEILDWDDMLEL